MLEENERRASSSYSLTASATTATPSAALAISTENLSQELYSAIFALLNPIQFSVEDVTSSITSESGGCASCDLVPCGYCQEGCPPSACAYDAELDEAAGQNRRLLGSRQDYTQRNGCTTVDGVQNAGLFPAFCRPSNSGAGSCSSCDLVPCGYCQEGCPFSTCMNEGQVDKPGATSRNGCAKENGILNARQLPPVCRPAPCASCALVPCGFCQEGCPPSTCSYESGVDKPGATSRNECSAGGVDNAGEVPPQCRPAPCSSCDAVPCGYCQEGCPTSTCTYENEVDKPFATDRNACAKVGGVPNAGELPLKCRPSPCASCDSVPCGYCQEGCPPSSCTYQGGVDKVGATSRNECPNSNLGELPTKCRAGTTPTAIVTVIIDVTWTQLIGAGDAIPLLDQDTLISVFQAETEAFYSSLSLAFTVTHQMSEGGTWQSGLSNPIYYSKLEATAMTNNPDAFSAISEIMLRTNVRSAADIALPSKIYYIYDPVSTSVSKLASIEEDGGESGGGGGGMGTGALIGIAVGAVIVATLVGAVVYRHKRWCQRWVRRQIPSDGDGASDGHRPQGLTVSRVDVCLSDVDACLETVHSNLESSQSSNPVRKSACLDPDDPDDYPEEELSRSHSVPEKFFDQERTQRLSTKVDVADVEQAPSA